MTDLKNDLAFSKSEAAKDRQINAQLEASFVYWIPAVGAHVLI